MKEWFATGLPVVSGLVSLVAIVLSIRADRLTRKLAKIDRKPHLDVFTNLGHRDLFDFRVANNGLGPATIEHAEFHCEQSDYSMGSGVSLNQLFGSFDVKVTGQTLSPSSVIPPGGEVIVVEFDPMSTANSDVVEKLRSVFARTGYTIRYRSWDGTRHIASSPTCIAGLDKPPTEV